jgi:hypothetical protein
MIRATKMIMAMAVLAVGMIAAQAMAQQVVSEPAVQPAPVRTRSAPPTRQYRSYSVNPTRSEVRRNGRHSGDATWRHAGAKSVGHYATGK